MPRALRSVPRATFEDLDAAIEERPPVDDRLVHSLPMTAIRPSPRNPRQRMVVDELKDSLDVHGLLQAIVVRRRGPGYELIAGHRRYEAAKQLGWATIDAKVLDKTPPRPTSSRSLRICSARTSRQAKRRKRSES